MIVLAGQIVAIRVGVERAGLTVPAGEGLRPAVDPDRSWHRPVGAVPGRRRRRRRSDGVDQILKVGDLGVQLAHARVHVEHGFAHGAEIFRHLIQLLADVGDRRR